MAFSYLLTALLKYGSRLVDKKKEGEITWELEHDLNEIKRLFDEVDAILESFNEKVNWNKEKEQED